MKTLEDRGEIEFKYADDCIFCTTEELDKGIRKIEKENKNENTKR